MPYVVPVVQKGLPLFWKGADCYERAAVDIADLFAQLYSSPSSPKFHQPPAQSVSGS